MFGSETMYGDPMSAPSYLGDTAPQTAYLGDGIAGGQGPAPAQTRGAGSNGRPNGKGIRLVPTEAEMAQALSADQARLNAAQDLTPRPGQQPGMVATPPSVFPLNGFQTSGLGELHPESKRWARFGVIDNGVLALSALAGFSLDDIIAKKVGVKGWGALVGALVGNAISDGVAAAPEGGRAATAVTIGALLPIIPVAIAMKMGKAPKGKTAWAVGAASVVLLALSFSQARKVTA